jgi:hypothetical protein
MRFLLAALLAAAPPALAADFRSVDDVLVRFEGEPPAREVQDMVLQYSKTDPRYVEKWLAASVNAAWLPELTFTYDHDDGYDRDYDYVVADPTAEPVQQLSGAGVDLGTGIQVRAKWSLDKLVMSSERIRVISESQDVVKLRDKILSDATRVYFDRRRLQVDMLLSSGDMKAQLKNELRLQELTAQLDAYTGGRFSEAISRGAAR